MKRRDVLKAGAKAAAGATFPAAALAASAAAAPVAAIAAGEDPIMPIFREREVGYMLGHAESRLVVVPKSYRGFDYPAMLELVATGASAILVARTLGISERTVRKHLEHLYAKLGVHDRLSAVNVLRGVAPAAAPPPGSA